MTHLLRRQQMRPRPHVRLRLEILEDRTLPSTLTVLNDGDSGAGSLRAALAQAADGDLINFAPDLAGATITLTSGELPVTANVVIQGLGADQLTVSGNDTSRVFRVVPGVNATISNLKVANGTTTDAGGGIFNQGTLTLDHCTVSGNTAVNSNPTDFHSGLGGGIFNDYQGALTLTYCTVSGNAALRDYFVGYGGGIFSYGSLALDCSQVSNNLADGGDGGGIYSTFELTSTAPLTLTHCTISDNRATGYHGGGIVCGSRGVMSFTDCAVTGNSAVLEGGGILAGGENGVLILDHCTVSGNTAAGPAGVLYLGDIAEAGGATITACTISDNFGDGLDALALSRMTVTHCVFSGNTGFGVHATSFSDMTISGCTVSDNGGLAHHQEGGGLMVSSLFGITTITASTISGNRGTSVGGLFIYGEATVSDCLILDNISANWGGGVGVGGYDDAYVTLDHCRISRNKALMRDGGGIVNGASNGDSTLTVIACTISDNVAVDGDGGGIANLNYASHSETITILDSTLSGNSAGGVGGALYNQGGATVNDSTFYGNQATSSGGAIFADQGATLSLTSATIDGNNAGAGGGISNGGAAALLIDNTIVALNQATSGGPDVFGAVQSQGNNLIGASDDSSGWVDSDILGTESDPVDPRLGPLQHNGGPTFTQALLPDSPAIAAGDAALLGTRDQRGVLRGPHVDIGAFQAQAVAAVTPRLPAPDGGGHIDTVTLRRPGKHAIIATDGDDPGLTTAVMVFESLG